jgi:hypothetical protein
MNAPKTDERDILNKLSDFPRIVDSKQWSRINEVFAEEIAFDYGDDGEQKGLPALLTQFRKFHDRCGAMQHLLGSIQIDVDGDNATTKAYVQARHLGKDDKANNSVDTHGEYIDRWQRFAHGWRIIRRDARWQFIVGDITILYGDDH